MTDSKDRAQSVFLNALEITSDGERAAFLDAECGADGQLREEVNELLDHARRVGGFLDVDDDLEHATLDQPIAESPGAQIGPYKLLQQLGEGGMGVVYTAEQTEPVERRVALKIVKPGMDTRQVLARFEAERRALALMDHPNIAKVLDAGSTAGGQPYFVMELVKGIPVTQFCDQHQLSPRERLGLFIPICQAVQHAHQKGIIHRDLKPSNILVARYDDKAVPKVIDFGVAKATGQRLTEKTMFTQYGQIVGTLEYMSPEQAQLNQLDIDTRSDVYSLGVLLYELLTGATPFDRRRLRSAAFEEMLRIIREEEPPRPSTRLSTIDSLPSIAANRHTEPHKLSTMLQRELDWIVMKALEKERGRRYDSANGLAADVERYLNDEPVVACPPSALYQFRKFARRHKVTFATVSLVAAALVLGIVGTTWQAIRAQHSAREAKTQRDTSRAERNRAVDANRLAQRRLERALTAEKAAESSRLVAEAARESEATLRQQREAQLARIYVDRGLRATEENDQMSSFIWFVEALRLEQGDPSRELTHRIRLAAAMRRCPKLLQVGFHTGPMRSAEFSSDGKYVLTRDHQNNERQAVQVWDSSTGERIAELLHETPVLHASFSPDGRQIVTGSADPHGEIKVWDATAGTLVLAPIPHSGGANYASFDSEGKRIVTASRQAARVWDVTTGELIGKPLRAGRSVLRAWFSEDGERIITGSGDHPNYRVEIWDIATGEQVNTPLDFTQQWPVHVSGDRQRLVTLTTGTRPKLVRLWELDTKRMLTQVRPNGVTSDTSLSLDGHFFATPCYEGNVPIWESASGAAVSSLRHGPGFTSVAFSNSGRQLVTVGDWDSTCRVWELAREGDYITLPHDAGVRSAVFSPNGRFLVTTSQDTTARVWDAATGQPVTSPLNHRGAVLLASFSPDSRRVATGGGREARVWNAETGQPMTPVMSHTWTVREVAFSPDGQRVVTASGKIRAGGEGRVWDAATGQPVTPPLKHTDLVESASFSPDGQRVLTASWDRTAGVWDATTGAPIIPLFNHASKVSHATFSPNGRSIATSCWGESGVGKDGMVHLWNTATGEPLIPPIKHVGGASHVSFSANGSRIATTSFDGNARIWDTGNGEQLTPEMSHGGNVYWAEFSADGLRLVTGASANTSRVWDAITGQPITPFLKRPGDGLVQHVSFSPDGRKIATASTGAKDSFATIWSLSPTDRPLADLTLFAQLLAGHRIVSSGALVALDPAEYRRIYETLRSKYPEDFSPSTDDH